MAMDLRRKVASPQMRTVAVSDQVAAVVAVVAVVEDDDHDDNGSQLQTCVCSGGH